MSLLRKASLLMACAAVFAVGLAAQSRTPGPARDTPAQTRAIPKGGTARISGRVSTSEGGRPVGRARVSINGTELPGGRAVLTDDGGAFDFANLPAGRYTLNVSKTGYVTISYGQRRPLQSGTPLQLAEGQELRGLDMRLPRGSVISGHIHDATGEPMPGTTVRVLMYRYAQGNRQLVPAGTAQTDDRGEYRVWGLNPGEYYVSATNRNLNINLGARGGLPGIAAPPAFGGPGMPPPAVETALAARGIPGDVARDDPSDLAYAPTYFPGVSSPNDARPVTVGLSAEVLGIDFTVLLVRTGRVTGRVNNADGGPAGSGNVTLVPDVGAGRGALGGRYGGRIVDGAFSIANVPPGRYILRAVGDGGRGRGRGRGGDPTTAQFAAQPLSVDGDVDGVFVTLAPGATISGNVTVQATATPVLPEVTQFRVTAPTAAPSDFGPNGQARVDRDGTFMLEGVAAGSRWIRAQAPRGWTLKSVIVDGREVIDTPLDIRGAQRISGVTLVFTDKLTEVAGTVADQQGTPMTDYTVLAFPSDSTLWRPQARQIATARPDQNGRYQLRGLPPGEYFLVAIDPAEQGEWYEPAFLDQQRLGASRFSLVEGETKTQDLRVIPR
jgi:protocatechuate 3,4-dioxygenase beta subunit